MREVLQRSLGLMTKFGDRARILICKKDAKRAFRRLPVDPDGTVAVGYVLGRYPVVDVGVKFG